MQTGLLRKKLATKEGASEMNFRGWIQLMLFLLLNVSCFFMDTRPWTLGSSSLIGQLCYATDLDTKSGPKLHRIPSASGGCSVLYALDLGYLGEFSGLGSTVKIQGCEFAHRSGWKGDAARKLRAPESPKWWTGATQ